MKKLPLLLVFVFLLVSCQAEERSVQSAPVNAVSIWAEVSTTAPTLTHTVTPTPTPSSTAVPTKTRTVTPPVTPSITAAPTEEPTGTPTPTTTPTPTGETPNPVLVIIGVNKAAEYVDIQNQGNVDVDLKGWLLVSEKGSHSAAGCGIIKVGETLRIWAMKTDEPGFSCGFSTNIWNNSEPDPAVLYNPAGVEVSRW